LLQIPVAAIHRVRSLSYRAEIGCASPTAIMMAVDQSASINHRFEKRTEQGRLSGGCAQ
jgi:hypothetical protein